MKNLIIAILGILCLSLYWSNRQKAAQIYINEDAATYEILEYKDFVNAADSLWEMTCGYVNNKYGEDLVDSFCDKDIYARYLTTYLTIKNAN